MLSRVSVWLLSNWYFQCWNEVVCDLYVVNTFVAASQQGGKAAAKGRVHVTRSKVCRAPWHCHLFYFKSIFFYYTFLGQGSHGAFEVVHSAMSLVGINCIRAAVVVVVGMRALFVKRNFRHSVLPFLDWSDHHNFKLASFRARIFSNITNSLIPQLSLSVQIVTDGAGNQDWSLKSGSGGRLVTLTINKKDHKISDQSLNSLPLDLGYKHHLHWSYSLPSFAATFDNEEHKSSIWFEKLILNISHIFQS